MPQGKNIFSPRGKSKQGGRLLAFNSRGGAKGDDGCDIIFALQPVQTFQIFKFKRCVQGITPHKDKKHHILYNAKPRPGFIPVEGSMVLQLVSLAQAKLKDEFLRNGSRPAANGAHLCL
jgi:hypothetical protein